MAIRRHRRGEPVPAGLAREIRDGLARVRVDVLPPLNVDPTTGTIFAEGPLFEPPFVRITGAGVLDAGKAKYPWVELVYDRSVDDMVPGSRTGSVDSDPLIELNGNPNVLPINVECFRDPGGRLRFRANAC